MLKTIFKLLLSVALVFGIFSNVNAEEKTFEVVNNKATLEVSKDSILVGTAKKNTSIIDLFSDINIDGKDISDEDYIKYLDVRYITKENGKDVDYKVNSDTDIIDKDAKVFVLFKEKKDGGLVDANSTFTFELKNFDLKEIGTVSNLQDNSYVKIYDVVYKKEEVKQEPEVQEEPVLDQEVLTENNTGIKDNILLILALILGLFALLAYPKMSKSNI